MDSYGLLGQTVRVGPWSTEVILVTDPEHAVPVEIARTGVHTIAVGTGYADSLVLPDLPANADVKSGDLLLDLGSGRGLSARLSGGPHRRDPPRCQHSRRSSGRPRWRTSTRCMR